MPTFPHFLYVLNDSTYPTQKDWKQAEFCAGPEFFFHEENETMDPLVVSISIAAMGYYMN